MWDRYQVIRTTFCFSPCLELCAMISVHLQLHFTFAFYRPTWALFFWMVLVLHSPPFLAQPVFVTCSIYFVCKTQEKLSSERWQGRFPHFPSSVQWELSCLSAPTTDEIATVERTVQASSPTAKSEAVGKICWYIKEPCGLLWGGDYHGAWKTCVLGFVILLEPGAGLKSPLDCISKPSAPGCVGKHSSLGYQWGWDPTAMHRVLGLKGK